MKPWLVSGAVATCVIVFTILFLHPRVDLWSRATTPQDAITAANRDVQDEVNRQLREQALEVAANIKKNGILHADEEIRKGLLPAQEVYKAALARLQNAAPPSSTPGVPPAAVPTITVPRDNTTIASAAPPRAVEQPVAEPLKPSQVSFTPTVKPTVAPTPSEGWIKRIAEYKVEIILTNGTGWVSTGLPVIPGRQWSMTAVDPDDIFAIRVIGDNSANINDLVSRPGLVISAGFTDQYSSISDGLLVNPDFKAILAMRVQQSAHTSIHILGQYFKGFPVYGFRADSNTIASEIMTPRINWFNDKLNATAPQH